MSPVATAPTDKQAGRRRNGGWRLIGAGIGGAAIAVLVLGGLWRFGFLPPPEEGADDEWTELADKVAALERQVGEIAARNQGAPDQRSNEIDTRLKKAAAPRASGNDPALTEKLADLDRRTEQALMAAREANGRAEAAASQAQKADAQTAAMPAERGELDALGARFTKLEQQLKANEQRVGKVAAGVDRTMPQLAERLTFHFTVPVVASQAYTWPSSPPTYTTPPDTAGVLRIIPPATYDHFVAPVLASRAYIVDLSEPK